ncbi:hypothetical protein LCGC14_1451120 [marine sediment metagenome]|uniref:Uncharacterized protein n=1 Tax=marine sediment metagenome TaxID=412755 RepID=A0A0F9JHR1_9ZZZZ
MLEMMKALFILVFTIWIVSTAVQWGFSNRSIGTVLSDQWHYRISK